MTLSAFPAAEPRGRADVLARKIREADVRIQRTNREADLLDRAVRQARSDLVDGPSDLRL
ncbi:hypothetical protein [Streptomyces sp. JV190]|uniref:hypothetical protein n=1 Tax=Streptomyces sp. JV190 TaxID=3002533 RepID=UPI002E781FF2|nr:hypothetical protein [Streptomyces sp. JV190]MEE1841215.1 hypothetical protein [Streptomyces sp. JV190]